jgi:hypothetical protein
MNTAIEKKYGLAFTAPLGLVRCHKSFHKYISRKYPNSLEQYVPAHIPIAPAFSLDESAQKSIQAVIGASFYRIPNTKTFLSEFEFSDKVVMLGLFTNGAIIAIQMNIVKALKKHGLIKNDFQALTSLHAPIIRLKMPDQDLCEEIAEIASENGRDWGDCLITINEIVLWELCLGERKVVSRWPIVTSTIAEMQ